MPLGSRRVTCGYEGNVTRTSQNPYHLPRLAAGSTAALPLPARHCCQATNMGAATAMDEYVPIRMPTTNANEKPFNTSPPKINSESTVRKVRPEVSTVRLRV